MTRSSLGITCVAWVVLICLVLVSPAPSSADDFDPSRVGWSALSFKAKKMTFSLSSEVEFEVADIDDFTNARWEAGVLAGDFGGANIVSLYGGYSLNPHVSVEVWGSQILGNFSNGWMGSVNLVHETWPDWRFSPFFTLGAGVIHTSPKSTIIQGDDRTDQVGHVGAGLRVA